MDLPAWFLISTLSLHLSCGVRLDGDQMLQIEDRFLYMEERLDREAKTKRESVQTILNVLFEIKETIAQQSAEQSVNSQQSSQNYGHEFLERRLVDSDLGSLVHALLKAFETQKVNNIRLQRHVENQIDNRIEMTQANLENRINSFEKNVNRQYGELAIMFTDIKQTHTDILENINDLGTILNSTNVDMQRRHGDLEIKLSDLREVNKNIHKTIEHVDQDLTVIQNFSDICARKILSCFPVSDGENQCSKFKSCVELQKNGFTTSGVYDIYPINIDTPLRVYCDQDTDGGGWVVFQRRLDGSEHFFRNWTDYEVGFGNIKGEFWLGNKNLHLLTASCCHELRIDMEDFENERRYAKYSNFSIGSTSTNYILTFGEYTGDAGDSLTHRHKGQAFSTYDNDNDFSVAENCAARYKGAWWYGKCHEANLNGRYLRGEHKTYADGINWLHWRGHQYSLKMTEMKLR